MEKHDSDTIASAYDTWSERYDSQANETRDLDELVLRRIVPDLAGRTVVECGCGTGKNSVWLASRCARLIGLDFSAGMLKLARSKVQAQTAIFLRQDITLAWPLADSSVDVVLFNLVLEHIEDLRPVFEQAARALRPGGLMALSEYHPSRVSIGKGPVVLADDGSVTHRIPNYLHTITDYVETARDAGMDVVSSAEWSNPQVDRSQNTAAAPDERPQLISLLFSKSR